MPLMFDVPEPGDWTFSSFRGGLNKILREEGIDPADVLVVGMTEDGYLRIVRDEAGQRQWTSGGTLSEWVEWPQGVKDWIQGHATGWDVVKWPARARGCPGRFREWVHEKRTIRKRGVR